MGTRQGFEIDHRAFRAQNLGRPPCHLIREAVQNAFDESPANVAVTIDKARRGVRLTVADDGPGFADERDIWTIFASGKRDDPTKRGRLGRGLKELIAVASESEVATAGKLIRFAWNGTLSRTAKRQVTTGTRVSCTVNWKHAEIDTIESYLRLFVPPAGTTLSVNGTTTQRPTVEHKLRHSLKTIAYGNDGVPREQSRTTDVLLYRTVDRWIYEMGIPVEKIAEADGFEWGIDVQQRVPLRPERDLLPREFVRSLYANIANSLIDRLPVAEMTDLWMEEAVGSWEFDKASKGKVYIERRFGANAARAIVNDTHDRNQQATDNGVNVIRTEHLSASVRDLVKTSLPSTADLYPVGCAESRHVPEAEWTDGERRFVGFAIWLAELTRLPKPTLTIVDAPQASCLADSAQSGTRIRINRGTLGDAFFASPRLSNWLPLIVHELAHRTGEGHDAAYWREYERLSGEAVQVVRDNVSRLPQFGV